MRYVRNLIPLFLILIAPLAASASVYLEKVEDSYLMGLRTTTGNGDVLDAGDETELFFQDNNPFLRIDWEITKKQNGTWNYKYELISEATASAPPLNSISHFTLDISEGAFAGIENAKLTINYNVRDVPADNPIVFFPEKYFEGDTDDTNKLTNSDGSVAQNDPDLTGTVEGKFGWASPDSALKFNVGIDELVDGNVTKVTYEFDSNRQAVWGNVFVKAGQWKVYNSGIGLEDKSTSISNFIAVPDSVIVPNTEIPEPATMLVWSLLGLIGVGLIRRRR